MRSSDAGGEPWLGPERALDLVEAAGVGALELGAGGEVLRASPVLHRLLGLAPGAVLGQAVSSLASAEDRASLERWRSALGTPGASRSCEVRLGPAPVWVRLDAAGALAPGEGVLLAVTDVTAARRAELLAEAVKQAPAGIMLTSLQGFIEYVNPAFEQNSGFSSAEVVGQAPAFLKSGLHDEAVYEGMWKAMMAARPWRGRLVNQCKDGHLVTGDVSIAPVRGPGGEVVSFVAVMRDVTQEVALQAQLVEAQKLESIGRLAAGVAHDFNNLLAVVLLSASELVATVPAEQAGTRKLVEEIHTAATRGSELTRQLLAFARKQAFSLAAVDLAAAVPQALKLVQRLLGETIAIEVRTEAGLWPVHCDPVQLQQVILNLAINARDAMPGGGTLTLESRMLRRGHPALAQAGLEEGDFVQLSVADTGTGMTPEVRSRIFDPLFTTKREGAGTGLGLATVQGIVAQSGGAVRCESSPGEGTTFFVYLPRAEGPVPAVPAPAPTPARPVSGRILLVEDEAPVRQAAARALEAGGFQVTTAANGFEALEWAERAGGPPDLVVTDVIMPGMDGGQLAAELRARFPGLKVLFISGYPDSALGKHGVLRPGVELLPKPFTGPELLERVRQVLAGAAAAAPALRE